MGTLLPWVMGATSVMSMINRNNANATMNEPFYTNEQIAGDEIQNFADRGILGIDANSPAVREAIRKRTLLQRQQQARNTLQSPDPFRLLPDVVGMFSSPGYSGTGEYYPITNDTAVPS